ncbi:L-histidine N(alpha)-methyltransferase [Vibrio sp. S4M6]|uniref:L-histidine N(alpha)-methyltransferase n=1 Tax=Vibrio sinus TaxID=2946865 RepID=UPI002029C100|nr:L-histidine N(alpha)-methyltransferase [Vibrio sinus]MCL9783474.1 L-histidine N(alpha)-methyltransferase [Vibrio sinus]
MNNVGTNLATQSTNVSFINRYHAHHDDRENILVGLQQPQKTIDPKYFYDHYGSELFEKITHLPEYYITRTEKMLLQRYANDIADSCGRGCILIEPGSGNSEKVRMLLEHIQPLSYVPIDVSGQFLEMAAQKLGDEFPTIDISAICADFSHSLIYNDDIPHGRRVFFYPGSTIGNMCPEEAVEFLKSLKQIIQHGESHGGVIIGIDLVKPQSVLHAAYNDAQGVTAEFNLNVLSHVNTKANANFKLENFRHSAHFNHYKSRIEMHLVSRCRHTVKVGDHVISFDEGESIHTENSYKYTLETIRDLAEEAGFSVQKSWVDDDSLFSLHYMD